MGLNYISLPPTWEAHLGNVGLHAVRRCQDAGLVDGKGFSTTCRKSALFMCCKLSLFWTGGSESGGFAKDLNS